MNVLARWESRGGAHYVELYKFAGGYGYTGNGCGGTLDAVESDEAAVAIMQTRVDSGYFLPDSAKVPMKRVGGLDPKVRVKSGPTYLSALDVWDVQVNLSVYSAKLAAAAYARLPEFVDFDGRIYRKAGMFAPDCTAWYRARGE